MLIYLYVCVSGPSWCSWNQRRGMHKQLSAIKARLRSFLHESVSGLLTLQAWIVYTNKQFRAFE